MYKTLLKHRDDCNKLMEKSLFKLFLNRDHKDDKFQEYLKAFAIL